MPYEYRQLTASERAEVVDERRRRGFPLHSPPHAYDEAGCFLVTAACYEHAPIMAADERRTELETRLLDALASAEIVVYGWVVLPNHYHVLTETTALEPVSTVLKHVHGSLSHGWNSADRLTGKRRVWYRFADRRIRDERHFYCALNYIHYNPVKHGHVESPYDWAWSSLGTYLDQRGQEWLREMWRLHPPADMGAGWDDR